MKWTNKGHEYDEQAVHICKNTESYYIWGAGTFGESFYEEFASKINIVGFLDSKLEKQGTLFCGLPVYSPDILETDKTKQVLVSAGWTRDIFNKLSECNYKKGENCFHIDDFISVYMMYHEKKLHLSNLTYPITDFCSLNCKHCVALIPYVQKKKHLSIEEIYENIDCCFNWVDHINVFGLSGGDAMVHPNFHQIVRYICEKYHKKKFNTLEIYTNAVIMPKEDTLALWKEYNVFVRFSNYGIYAQHKQKIPELIEMLEKNGIRYDHVQFEYWLDSGYPQEKNQIPEEHLAEFAKKCDRRSCMGLYDKKLYYCAMCIRADNANYCEVIPSDFFDLNVYDENKKKELMEYILGYSEKGYYNYCTKCNGSFNVNQKRVPVGEQLKK